ncbi:tetratricopeptide repeat protein [Auraticoccus monumenti]|uniref:Tetratricopeptide repeat-containing protein n=1 Tax=Auraticoccus monumenti TaxID=675864 RepID=A0A1G7DUQ7_9ACTN|nr:tetratricopeptide repeat protein [Auraticoccus monumenti]SDE55188.1 Tetratricopeptide repeat-containing protein [Auraticoccus monumenti]
MMDDLTAMRFAMAERRFAERDYRGAGEQLALVVAQNPSHLSARLLLARSHFHAALLEPARRELQNVLDQDPTEPYARLMMVRTLERQGRRDEAATQRRLAEAMGVELV